MDNKTNKHEFACNAGKVTEYEVKEHIDTIMAVSYTHLHFRRSGGFRHDQQEQCAEAVCTVSAYVSHRISDPLPFAAGCKITHINRKNGNRNFSGSGISGNSLFLSKI